MTLLLLAWLFVGPASAQAPPSGLRVEAPPHSDGLDLALEWVAGSGAERLVVLRRKTSDAGGWTIAADGLPAGTTTYGDRVTSDVRADPPVASYTYRVVAVGAGLPAYQQPEGATPEAVASGRSAYVQRLLASPGASAEVVGSPRASWLHASVGRLHLLAIIVAVGGLMLWFTRRAQQGEPIYIRRMPGIDAIEEGIGRATEMGRPVLYVPGIDELQDIQTIASMLILGQVAKTIAEYQTDIIVSCCIPIVREVADEVVKAGYFQAGHPDAYNPAAVRFISSEQFAFTAGTNGIMLRERPATNLYLGRFFAESLILAETGYLSKSIQIAGTAEATQLPFFVAACDYTLIGEELFAVSAYLSRDPRLVSSLKASDYLKVYVVASILVGALLATFGSDVLISFFTIGE